MAFFGNTKALGIMFEIVGVLLIIFLLIDVINGINLLHGSGPDFNDADTRALLITKIGSILGAAIYVIYANQVMKGEVREKLDVVAGYVKVVGIAGLVTIFAIILGSGILDNGDISAVAPQWVADVAVCVIITALGFKINNRKVGTRKRILWGILVIAFAVMIVLNLLPANTESEFVSHIVHLIIAVFMIMLLADNDVKIGMGIA